MTICKFYLQGNCKFGNRCRNEHVRSSGPSPGKSPITPGNFKSPLHRDESYNSGSFGRNNDNAFGNRNHNSFNNKPNNFGRNGQVQNNPYKWERSNNPFAALSEDRGMSSATSSNDNEKIVEMVKQDVKTWAESKMWPYSAYSCILKDLVPEGFLLEGLPDICPEELQLIFRLHGKDAYMDIIEEIDATYSRRKDELFMMNGPTKSTLCSQIRSNQQNSPSASLKLAALYDKDYSQVKQQPQRVEAVTDVEISELQTAITPAPGVSSASPFVSVFGSSATPAAQDSSSTGLLSSGKSTQLNKAYTPINELTEDEISAYKAATFTLYKVPERPPPKELCCL